MANKTKDKEQFPFGQDYDWKAKVFLGEGSYGKVYKAKNLKDGKFYAIKSIDMEEFNRNPTLMAALKGELAITKEVQSPYTVKMMNSQLGHKVTYMVLQLCDSDLRKQLTTKKLTQPQCVEAFAQIMKGFQVLVGKGYIHRDIKPANVLVISQVHKVADFGFACKADVLGKKKLSDICGTPLYMAPQLLKNQPYTAQSDIWSLGLMLYEMVFGYTPWPCRSIEEYLKAITTQPLKFPFDGKIGKNTKDFIQRSLVVDENKRIDWKQIFEHPLIKQNNTGQQAPKVNIDQYVKNIYLKIQQNITKRSINVLNIVNKYKGAQVNLNVLSSMLREIDPTITSHQIQTLLTFLDAQKNGSIPWKIIEQKVLFVDFRSEKDVLSRKLDEVIAIIKQLKLNPNTLFDKIDHNHNNIIDFEEFSRFIASIAPKYTNNEIVQVFKLLDADKDGIISTKEFTQGILSKLPSQDQNNLPNERAKRNIQNLANYMKEKKISAGQFLKLGNTDKQGGLTFKEFEALLNGKLKFKISTEEVKEIFNLLDLSQNEVLALEEIANLVKK